MMDGYIYCFSNDSMPGILKVGMTERTPEIRLNEANNSDTWRPPTPYKIEFAKQVLKPKEKEKKIHNLLEKYAMRDNLKREFFRVSREDVMAFFDLIDGNLLDKDTKEEEDIQTTIQQSPVVKCSDTSKKSEYNKKAYEKRKAKLVSTVTREQCIESNNDNNDNNDKYYNKYKEMKKEHELVKQELMELRIEVKFLKQQLENKPTPQAIQPIVHVLTQPKLIQNKTKIHEFHNAMPINQFFSEIKIDSNDIRTLKNIRGCNVNDKIVNFIHDVIKKRYDEFQEDEKPFYCSDQKRKTLHFKQNDYVNKKVLKEVVTKEEMLSNGFNLYNYKDCLNEQGNYEFSINERCYDKKSKWLVFHENDNTDNLFYYISSLIKSVINNYSNAIQDIKQMACDENTEEVEISPLKILTTSLKDNFNKIIKSLCDISYLYNIIPY